MPGCIISNTDASFQSLPEFYPSSCSDNRREKKRVARDRNVNHSICLSKCLAAERECLLLLAMIRALVLITWVVRLALVVLSLKKSCNSEDS